jgi:hypothetical protein
MRARRILLAAAMTACASAACTTGRQRTEAPETYTPQPTYTAVATQTPVPPSPVWTDDFEQPSGGQGWSFGSAAGSPMSWSIGSPTNPVPFQGTRCLGTRGSGSGYAALEDSWALSPPWSLPASSQWDGGRIEATTNGGASWTAITPIGGYNGSIGQAGNAAGWPVGTPCFASSTASGWMPLAVALAPYAGTTLRLRFRLASDSGLEFPGWYLDQAKIQ